MSKQLLFSVTKKDLRVEFYRGSGAGGQKRNKTSNACRITHIESGAVGKAEDERHQAQNKKLAFRRMINTKEFQSWLKVKAAAMAKGFADVDALVDKMMDPMNLKEEYFSPKE